MNRTRRQQGKLERRAEWRQVVAEAEHAGFSIREFCKQRQLNETQFYRWRRLLRCESHASKAGTPAAEARFVLVRPEAEQPAESMAAALELVLDRGWRLRIARGADEATLRSVLAALAPRP